MTPCIFLKEDPGKCRHILILIPLLTWSFVTIAQQRAAQLDQALALPAGAIRLDSLGNFLAHESGFVFSFNADKINPQKKIIIPRTLEKLNDLLAYLNKHYGLQHSLIGNHIILHKPASSGRAPAGPGDQQEPVLQKESARINKPQSISTLPEKVSLITPPAALPDIGPGITFRSSSILLPKKSGEFPLAQSRLSAINTAKPDAYLTEKQDTPSSWRHEAEKEKELQPVSSGKGNDRLYVSAGVTADEVLYAAPGVSIGLPRLFATASWATDFKTSGLLYGLGTSIQLPGTWDLRLTVSYGTLSRDFKYSLAPDTTIMVKAGLARINILAEKQIGRRFTFAFGPILNFMKSRYTLNYTAAGFETPMKTNMSNDYYALHPLYTISKNYHKKTASGDELWIGLQIGLSYRLW